MGCHFWLGYNRLSLLPTPTLLRISLSPTLPLSPSPALPLSPSPSLSLFPSPSLSLSPCLWLFWWRKLPCWELPVDAHRKKQRPSVQQPMRGLPATTHLSRKQIDPPPAEPAGETAAPSDTWHPAQPRPDPDPWRLGFDTRCFEPLSLGNVFHNRKWTHTTNTRQSDIWRPISDQFLDTVSR